MLTAPQKILLAARALSDAGPEPFTIEQLVVAAWKLDKKAFGLKGFADKHPNSNVVYSSIMGQRGLVFRGYLDQCQGSKVYTLSDKGRVEAGRADSGVRAVLPVVQLSREDEENLTRLLRSKAYLRIAAGQGGTVNFTDALAFWFGQVPDEVDGLVETARGSVARGVRRLRSGQEVRSNELWTLRQVNAWLAAKFARELERRSARHSA